MKRLKDEKEKKKSEIKKYILGILEKRNI